MSRKAAMSHVPPVITVAAAVDPIIVIRVIRDE
jgi:hypothetical protein